MIDPKRCYHAVRRATALSVYLVITLATATILLYLAVGTHALVRSVWGFFTG
ncbi:hypothetical protein [Nocardiopsis alkaliphila]|uniref:hypothetical protein n=1 Tax=Nocardiopsis alkaliphila TaxID=225762 RepID=UPI00034C4A34|nr:hypothetical protein [Nocardiopsis alkaliphila]